MIMKRNLYLFILLIIAVQNVVARGVIIEPSTYIKTIFEGNPPEPKVLWLIGDIKKEVKKILGHKYHKLRVKYWKNNEKTLWILEEIGKEKYITTGVVVNNNAQIEDVSVLIFRESRGWEVKYDFFTEQFDGLRQKADTRLSEHIDAITGATLSVNALRKQARMALYLHGKI